MVRRFFFTIVNWHRLLPPEMLNEYGRLPYDGQVTSNILQYGPLVSQLPMLALIMMRSEQLADLGLRNAIVGGVLVVFGIGAVTSAMTGSVANLQPAGGRKVRVNPSASAFKSDGSINNRTSILGHRRAHLRGFRPVRGSHNKYTL